MRREQALKIQTRLGKDVATAVEYTGGIIYGFEVVPTKDLHVGGTFAIHGVLWEITEIVERPDDFPLITIYGIELE